MNRFFRKNKLAAVGFVIIATLTLVALFAPWILPYDPSVQDLATRLEAPTWDHPFGNDELGRDILSRVLLGTRISMRVGATVVLLSGIFGVLIGGFAGYVGGQTDLFVTVIVVNSLMAFPGILLAIALVAFLGPGIDRLIFALSVIGLAGYARLARGQVLKVKTLEFVEAARALGASGPRIFFLHVLPSIIQPILVQASIGMAAAILLEASLSFLGLGIAPPTPSWGAMLNDGRGHLFDAPHMVVFPSVALVLTVLSFNFLGDALRDWLDPKSLKS
ncbi:MAG TPA: ABC transporter permease [Terriglobia bacterium]|jgi:peptide/nickel transport system permease protein|nr:ABC transporter permease [Terriglobia bacterium]